MDFGFKKKYVSLDSCVILRIMLRDNLEQTERAKALILGSQNFYVDDVAIIECVYVLEKKHYTRVEIAEFIQSFLLNPMIFHDNSIFDGIFEKYVFHPSLSFEDLVLASRNERHGYAPLWTFDQKFARQSKVAKLVPVK